MEEILAALIHQGHRQVLVAAIGGICDHVETLYGMDIELKKAGAGEGVQLERISMLNASAALIDVLTWVIAAHESSLVY